MLIKFLRLKINEETPDYWTIIPDEVADRFFIKEI